MDSSSRRTRTFALCLLGLALAMLVPLEISAHKSSASNPPDPMAEHRRPGGKIPVFCAVLDPDGRPVEGAVVYEQINANPNRFDGSRVLESDPYGRVTFYVDWTPSSHISFRACKGDAFSEPRVKSVNGKVVELRLHKVKFGSVRGTVRDEKGSPISGAKVSVICDGEAPFCGDLASLTARRSGPGGTYRFDDLYPGASVKIDVIAPGRMETATSPVRVRAGKVATAPDLKPASAG